MPAWRAGDAVRAKPEGDALGNGGGNDLGALDGGRLPWNSHIGAALRDRAMDDWHHSRHLPWAAAGGSVGRGDHRSGRGNAHARIDADARDGDVRS